MKRFPKRQGILPTLENPQYKTVSANQIKIVPDRAVVLEDMLKVAWCEVGRLKKKQEAGLSLDSKEVRMLTGLIDAVTKLSKEQRDQDKEWQPEDLSDEEALLELEQAHKALKEKIENKKKAMEGENEIKGTSE